MQSVLFNPGEVYARRMLQDRFGGQRQGGISTPAKYPVIFLFTGLTGERYGYHDGWTEQGTFLYTGEGQLGNMEFVRGNATIRDSTRRGKDLHLFKYVRKGMVEYLGQMVYHGYQIKDGIDANHHERKVIKGMIPPSLLGGTLCWVSKGARSIPLVKGGV